jgi:hypothetical protein
LSSDLDELIAVVGLRGGSQVTGELSAQGLTNGAVEIGPTVSHSALGSSASLVVICCAVSVPSRLPFHSIDDTIDKLRIDVEDPGALFGAMLETARGSDITMNSAYRRTFVAICTALWNSELCESVCGQGRDGLSMENVVDRTAFLLAIRCDIITKLEFITSRFYKFLYDRDALDSLPFSLFYKIIGHGSLWLESEDVLDEFISKGTGKCMASWNSSDSTIV